MKAAFGTSAVAGVGSVSVTNAVAAFQGTSEIIGLAGIVTIVTKDARAPPSPITGIGAVETEAEKGLAGTSEISGTAQAAAAGIKQASGSSGIDCVGSVYAFGMILRFSGDFKAVMSADNYRATLTAHSYKAAPQPTLHRSTVNAHSYKTIITT
jgi:hypothetical protein